MVFWIVWSLQFKFGFVIRNNEINRYNDSIKYVLFNDFSYRIERSVRTPNFLDCWRIFAAVKILPSINNEVALSDSEYANSWFSIIPAILIGISLALTNKIDSLNLYLLPLLPINSWLFRAFEIEIIGYDFHQGMTLDELMSQVYESDIDLLMIDYKLNETNQVTFNGEAVESDFYDKKPLFPHIIFTNN